MTREKNGAGADSGSAAGKLVPRLISDEKLLALHRKLLKAVARRGRDGAGLRNGLERYAAARVAVRFDLKRADTVIETPGYAELKGALDTAMRNKGRKNRRAVVAWGDGVGTPWETALEDARSRSLPVVFVGAAGARGRGFAGFPNTNGKPKPGEELPCITVDGHDVVAAYRVAHEAIERARRDRGPTLILLATYEVGGKAFTDAVADMERYLEGRGLRTGARGQVSGVRRAGK